MEKSKCLICGKEYSLEEYRPESAISKIMDIDNLCFNCAFWKEKFILSDGNTIVSDNTRYRCSLVDIKESKGTLAYDGGDFYFQMLNDPKDVRHYNNCWCQGVVPDNWKDKIPNNAKQISKQEYLEIKKSLNRFIYTEGDDPYMDVSLFEIINNPNYIDEWNLRKIKNDIIEEISEEISLPVIFIHSVTSCKILLGCCEIPSIKKDYLNEGKGVYSLNKEKTGSMIVKIIDKHIANACELQKGGTE